VSTGLRGEVRMRVERLSEGSKDNDDDMRYARLDN
jgi:hypothetical protein